jgi:hypothetical protein
MKFVMLGSLHPAVQLGVLEQTPDAKACHVDTMNFGWTVRA